MENLKVAITAVIEGDISSLSVVLAASHPEIQEAAAKLPQLTISRSALIKVLKEWRSGYCAAADVQQWASFVRRGYVARATSGALHPIDIEYDAIDEELIVEIIGRLDEIGDLVDGDIDNNEREEMLKVLGV
ncbi:MULTISPECIES: hypothetical protein [unclassified Shinella]|uniref:hypothetical protein n=1 Tax=unclassified Shinella TaxID=2643062 RepID=UPI00234F861E|nr:MULTISPECIES: hypothetical protein [unclassified Shinella]MCO5153624.1 hypothetical protein [Shinella sp.]MDC7259881.1 hypothetical protein [Shinella sp. YE25]CAK7261944.1 conserved protein of unknown function [Shinella sp. WSC3-e]